MIARCNIDFYLDDEQIADLKRSCHDVLDYTRKIRAIFAREMASGDMDTEIESFVDELTSEA